MQVNPWLWTRWLGYAIAHPEDAEQLLEYFVRVDRPFPSIPPHCCFRCVWQPEVFADKVYMTISDNEDNLRWLAEEYGVSELCVRKWSRGTAYPLPRLMNVIYRRCQEMLGE